MLLFEMLSGRHPRWRCNSLAHRLLSPPDPRTSAACQCPLPLVSFQLLPTIKVCNPFILITMQIARGVGGTRPTAHLKKNLNCCRLGNSPLATPHSPLSSIFNNLRTPSFSVDKRVQANSFAINCLRTLSQNMGGWGCPGLSWT